MLSIIKCSFNRLIFSGAAALFTLFIPASLATSVYYTFHDGSRGGLAEAVIDKRDHAITTQRILMADADFDDPHKIALTADGRYLAGVSQREQVTNLLIYDLRGQRPVASLALPEEPDAIEAAGGHFIIGARKGDIYRVEAATGNLDSVWNARRELRPRGHKVEYITVAEDQNHIWFSFQKDSRSGQNKGSRVLLFSIEPFSFLHDLQLPRNRPDLHMEALRERGPNPEIIEPSYNSNTLLLSLDLYGAVAMADLDAAAQGDWKNLTYLPAAPDESWGESFPDRATMITWRGRDLCLMTNQGRPGGALLVDLAERRVKQRFDVPNGLEAPIHLPTIDAFVCIVPGKLKWRGRYELESTRTPLPLIYLFEYSTHSDSLELSISTHDFPRHARRAMALAPAINSLLLVHTRADDGSDLLTITDAASGTIVEEHPALGKIGRMVKYYTAN